MTIVKKADQSGLTLAEVIEIAKSVGITSDPETDLATGDAVKLGSAVKAFIEGGAPNKSGSKEFRVWCAGKNRTIFLGEVLGSLRIRDHVLVLDTVANAETVKLVKKLKNVIGLYEVTDVPFDDNDDEYYNFDKLLRSLVFTGTGQEQSRGGIKAVRALFRADELLAMGDGAFNPNKLITKALRSKSIVQIHNV